MTDGALFPVGTRARKDVPLPVPLPARIALAGAAREVAWPAESLDLVEVATAVLLADRWERRRGPAPRRLHLRLPVRRPTTWRRLQDDLNRLLYLLTDDSITFTFRRARREEALMRPPAPATPVPLRADRVALFSGGLDSACAAAMFARAQPHVPTVQVSHYVRGLQHLTDLLSGIGKYYLPWPHVTGGGEAPAIPHAGFYMAPVGITRELRETSRRSRSFFFLSLAAATARGCGAREVCVCENGPLALNLPLHSAMIPTRHAHGSFLYGFERLVNRLFEPEAAIRVVNPFELTTKGEMAEVFAPNPAIALSTVSCWNQQWAGRGRGYGRGHCGYCFPCLVRRASLTAAGIPIPPRHFDLDVVKLAARARSRGREQAKLADYRALVHFCERVRACGDWREFLNRFPEASSARPTASPLRGEEWFHELFLTLRRFADEVRSGLVS